MPYEGHSVPNQGDGNQGACNTESNKVHLKVEESKGEFLIALGKDLLKFLGGVFSGKKS